MVDHHTIDASGIALHVVTAGSTGAPPVVLLHGWPEDWRCWSSVIELLGGEFMVVAPDQRGFGQSDAPSGTDSYRLPVLLGDLVAIFEYFGMDRPRLVGHDVGGALVWACGSVMPDRIERAVVLASPHPMRLRSAAIDDPRQLARAFYVWLMHAGDRGEELLTAGGFKRLASWLFAGSSISPELVEAYRADWARPGRFRAMAEWYRANYRPDLFNPDVPLEMPAVRFPVRYLHAELDGAFVPGAATGSGEYVQAPYEEQVVEKATHWLTHDAPELVVEAIRGWMIE